MTSAVEDTPYTIVLVGPHGAGKTTLGEALGSLTGWTVHDELGRRFAEDPRWRPTGASAEHPQPHFDEAVLAAEHHRDRVWSSNACKPRIVETWHPGNLAYAEARSPDVARRWLGRLRAAVNWRAVLVVPVTASPHALAARQSEPGDLEFFARVAIRAQQLAGELGAELLPSVITDRPRPAAATPTLLARELALVLRARMLGPALTQDGERRGAS
ncbi:MAG: AAA family ATPase [Myxococcales bacterium]|nr:AAA family ATPase [Myxococcales bacterium]